MTMELDPDFHFGTGRGTCCGKPQGCALPDEGCLYRMDPRKKVARQERCQATCWPDAATHRDTPLGELAMHQCNLHAHHTGSCDPVLVGVGCPRPLNDWPDHD